jgi:hypothetical protein
MSGPASVGPDEPEPAATSTEDDHDDREAFSYLTGVSPLCKNRFMNSLSAETGL